ncbi:uncharacterized, partial [Tachysurus ichikawai]
ECLKLQDVIKVMTLGSQHSAVWLQGRGSVDPRVCYLTALNWECWL